MKKTLPMAQAAKPDPETDWDKVRTPFDDVERTAALAALGVRVSADTITCGADMMTSDPDGAGNSMQHELTCIDLNTGLSAFDSV